MGGSLWPRVHVHIKHQGWVGGGEGQSARETKDRERGVEERRTDEEREPATTCVFAAPGFGGVQGAKCRKSKAWGKGRSARKPRGGHVHKR